MTINELENLIYSNFTVADHGVVRLLCAILIVHRFEKVDPVWLFLISPPSGLKSELIRALNKVDKVYPLSSLTPQTFISGQKNYAQENSLLRRLKSGILTFKDFTTILQMYESARQEILSQLREIYDGQYSKSFGTGEEISWEGKITFIAGVTEAIDLYQGMYSILGERFLQYRMVQPDRVEATVKALKNSSNSEAIRLELIEAFADFINNFEIPELLPEIEEEWETEIIQLADFATRGRSGIKRDPKDREISHVFDAEMPMRFARQLILLAKTFTLMGYEEADRMIIRKIAIDSLPKNRIKAFSVLLQTQEVESLATVAETLGIAVDQPQGITGWTTAEVAVELDLPTTTVRRTLQDLNALGFLNRTKSSSDIWSLEEGWEQMLNKYLKSLM